MTDSETPATLVAQLLAVTERLTEVVAAETAVLRRPGVPDVRAIAPEKSKLAVRYDSLTVALTRHPPATLGAIPGIDLLAQAVRRLAVLAEANAQAVSVHIRATRRVIDLVARAAQKATQPTFSYGRERHGYGARSSRNAAIAINRVL